MDENLKFYLELEGLKKYDALLKKHIPIFITAEDFKLEDVKKTVPPRGQIVIFTDLYKRTNSEGVEITSAGIKVGDGNTKIEQLPFIDWFYLDHINDKNIHVTKEQKTFWDNKITCKVDDETLNLKID